ncbi:GDP-L-fucose synthase family protein [Xanthobacteraceae bacterium A53D]
MKVFLTGGRGMVGRNIQLHPEASAHRIHAPTSAELDLTDRAATARAIRDFAPDLVIHSAGRVGGIQANIKNPVGFLTDNLDMGLNVVLASLEAGVPRLLNLGSSCMYPRAAPNPLTEDMILTGQLEPTNEGYALAKIAVARLCQYSSTMHAGRAFKTMVPCNLYGLHDKFDPKVSHLVPAIIRKVHEAKAENAGSVEIWGDGNARREFLFSMDLADAVWYAAARFEDMPELMNVGVGRDHSINDYYRIVADVLGWTGSFEHDLNRPVGMQQKLVSTQRQEAFGWMPRTSLEDGIRQTYDYFLATTH